MKCEQCGMPDSVSEAIQEQHFIWGEAGIRLKARVPVMTCSNCGDAYTDHRGEEARQAAVDAYKSTFSKHAPTDGGSSV